VLIVGSPSSVFSYLTLDRPFLWSLVVGSALFECLFFFSFPESLFFSFKD